ncbi:MAG: sulfurtransferase [Acidobacteria bacterium]|nr:sulfurtransferase [Acidobacteriota bacterium]MBV9477097.1 sulfurtransferase [Acidobacteriota bacterium]
MIVSPEELARVYADPDVVLLDARAAGYEQGHLDGARRANVDEHLSAARDAGADATRGGRHPLPPVERFAAQLGAWGIGPETRVIVYDDQFGANAAARAWWMLRALGHERVDVLDGGLEAATVAGVPVTTHEPHTAPRPPYPATSWQWPIVDRDAVDTLRNDPSWRVLDVRSGERYRGETEPIDPIAGHIPGALNLPFVENLVHGRFKPSAALRRQYEAFLGDIPPERVIVHCGSGVTACHTLLALEAAGLHGASLYVGSWSEWCRNEELPREPARTK